MSATDHLLVSPIVDAVAERGFAITPGFLHHACVAELRTRAQALDGGAGFAPARIGRDRDAVMEPNVRGDRICWLDEGTAHPAEATLLRGLDALRKEFNRELQLGLTDFEAHYAIYPPGAR